MAQSDNDRSLIPGKTFFFTFIWIILLFCISKIERDFFRNDFFNKNSLFIALILH